MRETLDTNRQFSNKDIQDGTWDFSVISCTKKFGGKNKDTAFYVWKVKYAEGEGEQILLPNMMAPLLRILGAKESKPNVFDFDTDDFFGAKFAATVSREPDKKDPSKMRQKMGHFQAPLAKDVDSIPF